MPHVELKAVAANRKTFSDAWLDVIVKTNGRAGIGVNEVDCVETCLIDVGGFVHLLGAAAAAAVKEPYLRMSQDDRFGAVGTPATRNGDLSFSGQFGKEQRE